MAVQFPPLPASPKCLVLVDSFRASAADTSKQLGRFFLAHPRFNILDFADSDTQFRRSVEASRRNSHDRVLWHVIGHPAHHGFIVPLPSIRHEK